MTGDTCSEGLAATPQPSPPARTVLPVGDAGKGQDMASVRMLGSVVCTQAWVPCILRLTWASASLFLYQLAFPFAEVWVHMAESTPFPPPDTHGIRTRMQILLPSRIGQPEDCVLPMLEDASYITGENIVVTGCSSEL